MTLTLHTIKPAKNSKKNRKRVGRGNASGHGTYSTRGQKGQRSRSGGRKGLKMKGLKTIVQSIPKNRGFNSPYHKLAVVNLKELEKNFNDNDLVTLKKLKEKDLIKTYKHGVKVLAEGTLTKKLRVQAHKFSAEAEAKIIKAGGQVLMIAEKLKKTKSPAVEKPVDEKIEAKE